MNTISAAVQKPAPRPDRDVAPSPYPAGALQTLPDPGTQSAFDLVMRAASGRATGSRAETDAGEPGEAGEPDGATGEDSRAEAGASPGTPQPPVDPGTAAAVLAEILSTAVLSTAPDAPPGPGTDAPGPAPSAASPADPDAVPEFTRVGNGQAAGPGSLLQGSPPKVEVLDRAVHFRPVLPGAVRRAPAAPAPATVPLPAAADAQLHPGRPGSAEPAAAAPRTARIALADKVAAAASKAIAALKADPDPRRGDAVTRTAATGIDGPGDPAAREDNRPRSGIAGILLASTGRQGPPSGPVQGAGNGSGSDPGQPAAALPTIAAAIKEEIERAAAAGPEGRVSADPAIPAAPDGPLRVLKIQLRPENLGIVTVELRLTDGQLETHLRASRPETAAMLHRDSAILAELLKQAHYRAEITVGPVRPTDAGSSAGGSSSQGQPAFTDGGARPGHGEDGQRQAERQRAEQRPAISRRDGERTDETVRPRDGGVYL